MDPRLGAAEAGGVTGMEGSEARYCDWIAADWGTTHLRAFAMDDSGAVVAEAASGDGLGHLSRDEAEGALLALIEPWLAQAPMSVILCGMVGSREGWIEAPYRAAPCTPAPERRRPTRAPTRDPRLSVWIVPGLSQSDPADVMRGEETQVAGWLADQPEFDGVLCLPGTHSKWVRVSAGEVVSFRTAMTGELFSLLRDRSVLRHTVGATGWDEDAFAGAVSDALSRPEALALRLFSLRAESLLHGLAPEVARARLSGLLIGAELAAMRPYWLGQAVAVVGAGTLAGAYAAALRLQGLAPEVADQRDVTLKGLTAVRRRILEQERE